MKVLWIQFPDSVNAAQLPKGTGGITVTDGTNSVPGGKVIAWTDAIDPEVVEHIHPATTDIGPPP